MKLYRIFDPRTEAAYGPPPEAATQVLRPHFATSKGALRHVVHQAIVHDLCCAWSDRDFRGEDLQQRLCLDWGGSVHQSWEQTEIEVYGLTFTFYPHHLVLEALNKAIDNEEDGIASFGTGRYNVVTETTRAKELRKLLLEKASGIRAEGERNRKEWEDWKRKQGAGLLARRNEAKNV